MYRKLQSNYLKGKRKELDYTQVQFAEILKVSHRTYQRLENGEASLTFEQLVQVIEQLGDDPQKVLNNFFDTEQ